MQSNLKLKPTVLRYPEAIREALPQLIQSYDLVIPDASIFSLPTMLIEQKLEYLTFIKQLIAKSRNVSVPNEILAEITKNSSALKGPKLRAIAKGLRDLHEVVSRCRTEELFRSPPSYSECSNLTIKYIAETEPDARGLSWADYRLLAHTAFMSFYVSKCLALCSGDKLVLEVGNRHLKLIIQLLEPIVERPIKTVHLYRVLYRPDRIQLYGKI